MCSQVLFSDSEYGEQKRVKRLGGILFKKGTRNKRQNECARMVCMLARDTKDGDNDDMSTDKECIDECGTNHDDTSDGEDMRGQSDDERSEEHGIRLNAEVEI